MPDDLSPATVTPLRPLEALGASLDAAPVVAGPAPAPAPAPAGEALPPAEPGGPGSRDRPHGEIWDGCPVRVLGVHGGTSYLLDVAGQLRAVAKLDRMTIMHLFGNRYTALCHHFPRWGQKDGEAYRRPGEFNGDAAASTITQAVFERGVFDPDGAVRGVGAWLDEDGGLVLHLGNRLLIGAEDRAPGDHQGRIYPAAPPIPHPAAAEDRTDPAPDVLAALHSWQWSRPDIDPIIAFGMAGVLMFGGALDWRPAFWVTGGAGAGKSTFQKLILHLMGGEKGLVQSTDATARGIASLLGQSTLPVALDELEPGDQGREKAVVELARVASSGGRWLRGSSDQKGSSGQLRSAFLFSSILIPGSLKSQDLQRLIVLTLNPLPIGAAAPALRADVWRKRGARLRRAIIDRWPTWAARLDLWRAALERHGITGRNFDNWGTVLAMAQMMRAEALPSAEEMDGWCAKVARHIRADLDELGTDADEVLVHLLSQRFDPFRRGTTWTVAQWLQVAGQQAGAEAALRDSLASTGGAESYIHDEDQAKRERAAKVANNHLAGIGLRVIVEDGQARLFVAKTPVQGLRDLFRDSQWQGGAWHQSLMRVKGAQASRTSRKLAGIESRGAEIPFASMPGLAAFPADPVRPLAPVVRDEMEDFA